MSRQLQIRKIERFFVSILTPTKAAPLPLSIIPNVFVGDSAQQVLDCRQQVVRVNLDRWRGLPASVLEVPDDLSVFTVAVERARNRRGVAGEANGIDRGAIADGLEQFSESSTYRPGFAVLHASKSKDTI